MGCLAGTLAVAACERLDLWSNPPADEAGEPLEFTLDEVARLLASVPIGEGQVAEVRDAVASSSGNGYDEEYPMRQVFETPGTGVGGTPATRVAAYPTPLRDLLAAEIRKQYGTRALDGDAFLDALSGSDVQSRFIISGFQSFKALSDEACRPFDKDRRGLNLGEAAATIIFKDEVPGPDDWCIVSGAVRNDANHISGPSRTGEGSFRALKAALGDFDPGLLAMVSVHGTSTPYNDEMEAIAIARAGLDKVPVSCLKGVFGHTMGAAGILETILSMASVDDGTASDDGHYLPQTSLNTGSMAFHQIW